MDRIESPIFLVGSVRSGTTLLGDMLGHHPDIAFPGEFELAVDYMGPDGETPDLAEYHAWLEVDRHFLWHKLEIDHALDYRQLLRSFLGQMASQGRDAAKPWIGVTVHRHYRNLVDLWPEARFIHLVRDPRDVGASIIVMGWAGNPYTAARQWSETEEEWERTRSRIPEERRFEVRFEDLAADPRGVLAGICEFAGVPYREEMMSYPEDSTYE